MREVDYAQAYSDTPNRIFVHLNTQVPTTTRWFSDEEVGELSHLFRDLYYTINLCTKNGWGNDVSKYFMRDFLNIVTFGLPGCHM